MADVSANLKDWSTTASSNAPSGATTIGTGLDDNLREIQKVVRQDLASKGSDIASAATADLGAVAGFFHDITGTTTITGLGTVSAGITKWVKFEGVATLIHNGTSLILPGSADIITANGDAALFVSEGSGNWRMLAYQTVSRNPKRPVYGTETTTTSGTAVTVSGIPAWVTKITILGEQVSTSGTSNIIVQPGSSAGFVTTGYTGSVSSVGASTATFSQMSAGFGCVENTAAGSMSDFTLILHLKDPANNTWQSSLTYGGTRSGFGGGAVSLPGSLDRFRLTTNNGTDTFDNGSFMYILE